jgi:phosphatidylinositol-3-phosphatase
MSRNVGQAALWSAVVVVILITDACSHPALGRGPAKPSLVASRPSAEASAAETPTPTPTPSPSPSPTPSSTAIATTASSPKSSPGPSSVSSPSPSPAPAPSASPTQSGGLPHVMVIVEENNSYSAIIGNSQLPYINSLAQTYGLETNWWGVSHPSLPNYLAMASGSIWNNPADTTPQNGTYPGPTFVDELASKGIGWKAYMEDMPKPCDLTDTYSPGSYDVNHNPFMYFDTIRNSNVQCNRDVPFGEFATDLSTGQAPPFMFVVPNLNDDMHDGSYATADGWLQQQLKLVLGSSWYAQGGIVVLTWDEGESGGDQIATIVISASNHGVRVGSYGTHYGLTRAIEEVYGVGLLANSASLSYGDLSSLMKP